MQMLSMFLPLKQKAGHPHIVVFKIAMLRF